MKHPYLPLVIGLGAISSIFIFYFFVYVPKQAADKQFIVQVCVDAADTTYNDNWTQACKDAGDAAGCKLLTPTAILLDNRHEADKADCYRK